MGNPGWEQIGAAGGSVFVVLQMAAQALIQVGGAEPPFDASAQTIVAFFMARDNQLFDQSNFAFANAWVMLASLSLATGVVTIRTHALPRWLGWAGVLIAGGLLAARGVWASSGLVFIPFGYCYLWLIAVSIGLIRRASIMQPVPKMPGTQVS